jgi:hypothetical protein
MTATKDGNTAEKAKSKRRVGSEKRRIASNLSFSNSEAIGVMERLYEGKATQVTMERELKSLGEISSFNTFTKKPCSNAEHP